MISHHKIFAAPSKKLLKYKSILGYTNIRSTCRAAVYLNDRVHLSGGLWFLAMVRQLPLRGDA